MFQEADEDGSGQIELDEFVHILKKVHQLHGIMWEFAIYLLPKQIDMHIMHLFALMFTSNELF